VNRIALTDITVKPRINSEQAQVLLENGWRYVELHPGQRLVNGSAYYERRGVSSWHRYELPEPECTCVTDWQRCPACRDGDARSLDEIAGVA